MNIVHHDLHEFFEGGNRPGEGGEGGCLILLEAQNIMTTVYIIPLGNSVDIVEYHMYSTKVHSGSLCT